MNPPDIFAVQWGFVGLAGVVVALLIPKTTELFKDFARYGGDREWTAARRFSITTRWVPAFTLVALVLITAVGVADDGLSDPERRPATWVMLLTPILGQVVFVVVARKLVERVPLLEAAHWQSDDSNAPKVSESTHLYRTILRVVNDSDESVAVYWLPPGSDDEPQLKASMNAREECPLNTYRGHVFEIRPEKSANMVVKAGEFPSVLRIHD
jgi:hypothetical protein